MRALCIQTKQNKYEKRHSVEGWQCHVVNDLYISCVKITPWNDSHTVRSHGLHSMVIFIGSWNRKSSSCSSLTRESLKGLNLSQYFEDCLNVFKWHNPTILSKSCWHIFNASKAIMSWDNHPCNYFCCMLCSVHATFSSFLFHWTFKG